MLKVSDQLQLPDDAVGRTIQLFGGKGMGKTNAGSVLVEELHKRGLRFSVIDPLDVWWGLQHGAKRGSKGLDVVILGGSRGDIPIEPTGGAVIADFVADESVSTVIVLRRPTGEMWSNGERIRFVTDYCTRLFNRQGERRVNLMQVIDEAGRFVPQTQGKGDVDIAKCIGAIETLVEWGRNVGIGVTLITQRSARIAKNVSELADCMVCFRTVGPNSVAAIVDWFGEHIPKDHHKELVQQLRTLKVGEALVVSPGWLEFEGRVQFRMRETFDSSATPKPGTEVRAPGKATKPDLQKYRVRMSETIEAAKANDPKTLKARIADLEKQLKAAPTAPAKVETRTQTVVDQGAINRAISGRDREWKAAVAAFERGVRLRDQRLKGCSDLAAKLQTLAHLNGEGAIDFVPPAAPLQNATTDPAAGPRNNLPNISRPGLPAPAAPRVSSSPPHPAAAVDRQVTPAAGLTGPEQRILNSCAWWEGIGEADPGLMRIAIGAGYHPRTKGFQNSLGTLRGKGLMQGDRITDAGRQLAHAPETALTLADVHDTLRERMDGVQQRIFDTVASERGRVDRGHLAASLGYHERTKSFQNALGRLRTLGVLDYEAGDVVGTSLMYPAGVQ